MKKLSLAIIIAMFSMSLVACTNSAGTNINNVPGTNTSIDSEITIDKAKEIALEHAGLIESKVSFIKAEKDIDKYGRRGEKNSYGQALIKKLIGM